MKTYAIVLKSSKERYQYISDHLNALKMDYELTEAVDGQNLTEAEIADYCNMSIVQKFPWWLTKGAIGCALSHYNCYRKIVEANDSVAFIVEDDVVLPKDINCILNEARKYIKNNEIILFYYTSPGPCKLSLMDKQNLKSGSLLYPMGVKDVMTATAYLIGIEAAKGMAESVIPISVTADRWDYYYEKGAFKNFRVHYPQLAKTKNFKSAIDYIKPNSFWGKITRIVNDFSIPVFYQILNYKRKKQVEKMLSQFILVEKPSPLKKENGDK